MTTRFGCRAIPAWKKEKKEGTYIGATSITEKRKDGAEEK